MHLPDLVVTAAIRTEIHPGSVAGPVWQKVVGGFGRQPPWCAAIRTDHKNISVHLGVRVVSQASTVRRPAWRSRGRASGMRYLERNAAIASTDPDFNAAGPVGDKGDSISIG